MAVRRGLAGVILIYKGDENYYEKHHIIPKSLGETNDEENLVLLTATFFSSLFIM